MLVCTAGYACCTLIIGKNELSVQNTIATVAREWLEVARTVGAKSSGIVNKSSEVPTYIQVGRISRDIDQYKR